VIVRVLGKLVYTHLPAHCNTWRDSHCCCSCRDKDGLTKRLYILDKGTFWTREGGLPWCC
jgi:hypothetical protein